MTKRTRRKPDKPVASEVQEGQRSKAGKRARPCLFQTIVGQSKDDESALLHEDVVG
jgi:hypothetical protein